MSKSVVSENLAQLQLAFKKRKLVDDNDIVVILTADLIKLKREQMHPIVRKWAFDGLIPNSAHWKCKFELTRTDMLVCTPSAVCRDYIRKWKEAIWPGIGNITIV